MTEPTRAPSGLEIVNVEAGTITTLALSGDLDLSSGVALIDATRRVLRQRPSVVRLDLRDVAFLDLTGARALIRCRRLAAARQADFELTEMSYPVRRLLEISRLDALFEAREVGAADRNGHAPEERSIASPRCGPGGVDGAQVVPNRGGD